MDRPLTVLCLVSLAAVAFAVLHWTRRRSMGDADVRLDRLGTGALAAGVALSVGAMAGIASLDLPAALARASPTWRLIEQVGDGCLTDGPAVGEMVARLRRGGCDDQEAEQIVRSLWAVDVTTDSLVFRGQPANINARLVPPQAVLDPADVSAATHAGLRIEWRVADMSVAGHPWVCEQGCRARVSASVDNLDAPSDYLAASLPADARPGPATATARVEFRLTRAGREIARWDDLVDRPIVIAVDDEELADASYAGDLPR